MNNLEGATRKVIILWPWIAVVYTVTTIGPWYVLEMVANFAKPFWGALAGLGVLVIGYLLANFTLPLKEFDTLTSVPFYSERHSGMSRLIAGLVWFLNVGCVLVCLVSALALIALFIAGLFGWVPPRWR